MKDNKGKFKTLHFLQSCKELTQGLWKDGIAN